MASFVDELETIINCHSIENESDTPDWILAEFLRRCLWAWNEAVLARDKWYGAKTMTRDHSRTDDDDKGSES